MSLSTNVVLKFFSNLFSRMINSAVEVFMIWNKSKQECAKKIVLIIDDNANLSNLIKYRLIEQGYNVLTASNGLEGLERLKKVTPHLVILDINMPQMGGLEFYRKIATKHGRPKYPVLFLTERAGLEDICKDIAADGFLAKPFEIDVLSKEVERILGGDNNPVIFLFDCPQNPHVKKIAESISSERYEVIVFDSLGSLSSIFPIKKPSCILMEYMQKEMDGEEFIKKIREQSVFKDVPIIVYSFSGFKQYREKSIAAGAIDFIDNPSQYEQFLSAIHRVELSKGKNWQTAPSTKT